jgi:hypothetical protein
MFFQKPFLIYINDTKEKRSIYLCTFLKKKFGFVKWRGSWDAGTPVSSTKE